MVLLPPPAALLLALLLHLAKGQQDLELLAQKVPGLPGDDYPIFSSPPETSFICDVQPVEGYYADQEADCQLYHVCSLVGEGIYTKFDFLCPNGTIFNQAEFVCDWWFNVDCSRADQFYSLNIEVAEENARRQQEREDARAAGQEERERQELTAEQIAEIRGGGSVPPPVARTAQLALQGGGKTGKQNRQNERQKTSQNGRQKTSQNEREKASQNGRQSGRQNSGSKRAQSSKRGPKNSRFPPNLKTTKKPRPSSSLRKGQTSFLTIGPSKTTTTTTTKRPRRGKPKQNSERKSNRRSKNSQSKQQKANRPTSKRTQSNSAFRKAKSQKISSGRLGQRNKKRPERELDEQLEQALPPQEILSVQKEEEIWVQQKTQQQELEVNKKEEENQVIKEQRRLEAFEQRLQEQINQQKVEERAILEETKRLDKQRVSQQEILEEHRKQHLKSLNQQVQRQVEKAMQSDQRNHMKKLKAKAGQSPVGKSMVRKKVRRRRPMNEASQPRVKQEGLLFSAFGNGQSRFGFGG